MDDRLFQKKSLSLVIPITLQQLICGIFGAPRMEAAGAAAAIAIARAAELAWILTELRKKDRNRIRGKYIFHPDPVLRKDFWHYTTPVLGNELGTGHLETARRYGEKLYKISVFSGIGSGIVLLLFSPLVLRVTDLSPEAVEYLKWMLVMCSYYMVGKYVSGITIGGIFCAGGDSRFGFLCDMITLWCLTVPAGFLAAFVFDLPVLAVYFIINLDEIVKQPAVYMRYKKYKWLKDLTVEPQQEQG